MNAARRIDSSHAQGRAPYYRPRLVLDRISALPPSARRALRSGGTNLKPLSLEDPPRNEDKIRDFAGVHPLIKTRLVYLPCNGINLFERRTTFWTDGHFGHFKQMTI